MPRPNELVLAGTGLLLSVALAACTPVASPSPTHEPPDSSAGAGEGNEDSGTPDPAPQPGIIGVVSNDSGHPSGAWICARPASTDARRLREDLAPVCTAGDESGGFRLTLKPGGYRLVASAPGHRSVEQWVELEQESPIAELELESGGRPRIGEVVDIHGKGLAGVYVHVAGQGCGHTIDAVALTDAEGKFELSTQSNNWIEFRAEGFAGGQQVRSLGPDGPRYMLLPESVLVGRVVDAAGQPVAGARVAAAEDLRYKDFGLGYDRDATSTNDDGEFRPEPAQLRLVFDAKAEPGVEVEVKRSSRHPWAWLLRRVFAVDVLSCERCEGRMRLVEIANTPEELSRVLAKVGLGPRPPPRRRPALPGQLELELAA